MSSASIIGLSELDQHLGALLSSSPGAGTTALELSPSLFEDVKLRVTDDNTRIIAAALMPKLVALLKSPVVLGGQGPLVNTDAICSLATKLLGQSVFTFSEALAIAPIESLVEALGQDATPATNKLVIAVIDKATGPRNSASWTPSPAEAHNIAVLARSSELFEAFIKCWLLSPDTGVGDYAERVLVKLLDADRPPAINGHSVDVNGGGQTAGAPHNNPGQLWNIMFQVHSIYTHTILASCRTGLGESLRNGEVNGGPDEDGAVKTASSRSIAQSRVLSILPSLACLDFLKVAKSQTGDNQPALLEFAWNRMVEMRDPLMVRNLHSFYIEMVSRTRCFLTLSDRRAGVNRSSRPRVASLNNITDPELHFQVKELGNLLHLVVSRDPSLLAHVRALPNEAAAAAEHGLVTREDAEDLRIWVDLLLEPVQSQLAVR
ncbi:hypothetical protein F503_06021 [Ophiostoma piceae UAMH 11346]|uniref:Uncharacterized protein n=1 Tax=Ophiostoma piceae (strain UAMH 11346) TaxID=1262450 RepID=S3CFK4_OPHP1|nr:hypothetical protein F503_06021 [Ophiostoma piceae UAMH 11346]